MNEIISNVTCPRESELAAFAADPIREDWADLAAHIVACDRCCDVFSAMLEDKAEAKTTPEEDSFMEEFAAKHCRSLSSDERLQAFVAARKMSFVYAEDSYFLAAAPAGGTRVDEKKTPCSPEEEVRFVFAGGGDADYWRAELLIPPVAGPDTMLDVRVTGRGGISIGDGTLRLSGCALPLSEGSATLPFSLFLDGLSDTYVSLARAGRKPVEGRLLFF
jgi:ASC-1-like (ASCH) protein